MNNSFVSKLLQAGVVAAMVFGVVSTALAVPPFKDSFAFDFVDFLIGDCDDFQILNDGVGEGFFIVHFDQEGNVTKVNQHIKFSQSIYKNSMDTSIFLDGGPAELENDHFDFTGDQAVVAVSGVVFHITVPGHGVIFHEVGRTIFLNEPPFGILVQVGPNDLTEGNVDALCAALTP